MAENDAEDVEDVHDSYETEWFAEGDEIWNLLKLLRIQIQVKINL